MPKRSNNDAQGSMNVKKAKPKAKPKAKSKAKSKAKPSLKDLVLEDAKRVFDFECRQHPQSPPIMKLLDDLSKKKLEQLRIWCFVDCIWHLRYYLRPGDIPVWIRRKTLIEYLQSNPYLFQEVREKEIVFVFVGQLDSDGIPCRGQMCCAYYCILDGKRDVRRDQCTLHPSTLSSWTDDIPAITESDIELE